VETSISECTLASAEEGLAVDCDTANTEKRMMEKNRDLQRMGNRLLLYNKDDYRLFQGVGGVLHQ
jgi:hypothetical protein